MDWNQKRIFITGATGLVGSWLTKGLLSRGAFVVVLIRDADPQSELFRSGDVGKVSVVQGSLEDISSIERAINEYEIDTVFHLGAQTIVGTALRDPLSTFESNIRGTYNLLEACRKQSKLVKRIVVASSDKAYGTSDVLPYVEDMPLHGLHPYDVSKSCTDLLASTYFHTYHLPIAILRCGNIFGGGDLNWSRLIPGTIQSLYHDKSPLIRSDGKFTRDYIYVEDVVASYLLVAESLENDKIRGQAFNFGPCKPYSVLEMVGSLQILMTKSELVPKIMNEAQAEIKDQYLSSVKARQLLGWKPRFSLEEGLKQTIAWYARFFQSKSKNLFEYSKGLIS